MIDNDCQSLVTQYWIGAFEANLHALDPDSDDEIERIQYAAAQSMQESLLLEVDEYEDTITGGRGLLLE